MIHLITVLSVVDCSARCAIFSVRISTPLFVSVAVYWFFASSAYAYCNAVSDATSLDPRRPYEVNEVTYPALQCRDAFNAIKKLR